MRTAIALRHLVLCLCLLSAVRVQQMEALEATAGEVDNIRRQSPEEYNTLRNFFVHNEQSRMLGADVVLNGRERLANKKIMAVKTKEYETGIITPHLFAPSQHFFSVLEQIRQSPLFQYITRMPKGAVLHAHDMALCGTDFLIKLTYRERLWGCRIGNGTDIQAFRFSKSEPKIPMENCEWWLMSALREEECSKDVDASLRKRFTLYPKEKYLDNNEAWKAFSDIFGLLEGLLTYAPVWADYYYRALLEFDADGVNYLEFRSVLPRLYDLNGTVYTELDTVRIYKETLDKFMRTHPRFLGSKVIYAPVRNVNPEDIEKYIKISIEIKEKYPDFVAGFDLVGQEELGRPLKDFVPQLLSMPDNINFFFHAGETNWFGSSVDENLIDAVLLGAKRIGHGYALTKHPQVLDTIKERDIAIEVNPISNQVLQLVTDYRNHPGAHFFADNYPVVVSSDDPAFWKATPLSHDFYIAFLGIGSAHADLRFLKKLVLNSLQYSSMSPEELAVAQEKWQIQWNCYIKDIIRDNSSAVTSHR